MSETNSDDDGFHPKQIFDTIRGPNYDTSGISTETEATVVGFGSDLIFTPIVGGHLNFSSPTEDDSEYPVKKNNLPDFTSADVPPSTHCATAAILALLFN